VVKQAVSSAGAEGARSEAVRHGVEVLKAVAHPLRLALLDALSASDEECVCHLSYLLKKPQPYVSKHLAALHEAGLVVDRRDGQRTYYRIANPGVVPLLDAALAISGRTRAEHRDNLAGCPCPRCG
jgi:DNA-binding transcriptional ArsR family regulator